jgi:acyl-CoA dehydrogenase
MRRNHYTAEHEAFRASYRRFLEREVIPHRAAFRAAGMVPRDVYRKAGERGFLCSWIDEAYGGWD